MKTVEELGISRRQWELMDDGVTVVTKIDEGVYGEVAECSDDRYARLIAAAPELYECLREAVVEACHEYCQRANEPCEKTHAECFVQRWRTALAKAVGEEAKR